jgi:DNA replication protein DnaC
MMIDQALQNLKLNWIHDNIGTELADAARKQRGHQEFLDRLLAGELEHRSARAVERRLREAHLPARKSLDSFDWTWAKKVNKDQIKHIFNLRFMEEKTNVVFIGGTGLGKTHLALALAIEACQQNRSVRFSSAADIINTLTAALDANQLATTLKRYTNPELLIVDELGYLPVDQKGANLLFQVFTARYERNSTVITTNRMFKDWSKTFDNDATLTSAVLDRIVHHCEVIVIEGRSYRLKGQLKPDTDTTT